MSQTTSQRPTQASFGGWLVVVGSALVVASQFSTVATLRSLDTRRQVEEALSGPPFEAMGVSVSSALSAMHVLAVVTGGCAAAMAVLGGYALRRHRASRIALSVLALPLLVAGLLSGGLLVSLVAVAVVMLWLQPSRDWYDGVTRRGESEPQKVTVGGDPDPSQPPTEEPSGSRWRAPPPAPEVSAGRPHEGYGAAPQPWGRPWPQAEAPGALTGPGPRAAVPARPRGVLLACVLTWVFSALAALLLAAAAVGVWANPGLVMDEVRRVDPQAARQAGITEGSVVTLMVGFATVGIVWSIAASVLAGFAFRRHSGARIALVVSSLLVAGLLLVLSFGAFVLVVPLAAAVATSALLLRPEARRWYAARR